MIKETVKISIFVTMACALVSPYLNIANACTQPKDQSVYPPFLKGTQITFLESTLTLPSKEPCFVCSGWIYDNWKTLSSDTKRDFFSNNVRFELTVDGVKQNLWLSYRYYMDITFRGTEFKDVWFKLQYIQFRGNTFAPGSTHVFVGTWYSPE